MANSVITIQVGPQSNLIGKKFWNFQNEYISSLSNLVEFSHGCFEIKSNESGLSLKPKVVEIDFSDNLNLTTSQFQLDKTHNFADVLCGELRSFDYTQIHLESEKNDILNYFEHDSELLESSLDKIRQKMEQSDSISMVQMFLDWQSPYSKLGVEHLFWLKNEALKTPVIVYGNSDSEKHSQSEFITGTNFLVEIFKELNSGSGIIFNDLCENQIEGTTLRKNSEYAAILADVIASPYYSKSGFVDRTIFHGYHHPFFQADLLLQLINAELKPIYKIIWDINQIKFTNNSSNNFIKNFNSFKNSYIFKGLYNELMEYEFMNCRNKQYSACNNQLLMKTEYLKKYDKLSYDKTCQFYGFYLSVRQLVVN